MRWFYSDWTPGRIGVVDHAGLVLAIQKCRFKTSSQMGEMAAIDLAVSQAHRFKEQTLILSDSLSAVKMISGAPYKPHPNSKLPDAEIEYALKIREKLRSHDGYDHLVSWIPRQSNFAHKPLINADI